MKDIRRYRQRVVLPFLLLLCATCVERRLSELEFNDPQVLQIESDDPDGDEIYNRLVFFDTVAVPQAPTNWTLCDIEPVGALPHAHSLLVRSHPESRAPPPFVGSSVA